MPARGRRGGGALSIDETQLHDRVRPDSYQSGLACAPKILDVPAIGALFRFPFRPRRTGRSRLELTAAGHPEFNRDAVYLDGGIQTMLYGDGLPSIILFDRA